MITKVWNTFFFFSENNNINNEAKIMNNGLPLKGMIERVII